MENNNMIEYVRVLEQKLAKNREQMRMKQSKYVASHRDAYREYQRIKQREYYEKKKAAKKELQISTIPSPEPLGEKIDL